MSDDPIDKMLQREDTNTARTKGTMDEARQSTSEMARPGESREGGGVMGILRGLYRGSSRKSTRDSRD